jgi:dephospho-CoA kinase
MGDRGIRTDGSVGDPPSQLPAPYVLGGGIGAGKSTVLAEFQRRGFVVIEADAIGHEVLRSTHPVGRAAIARWPETVADGEIDRSALAKIVFSDQTALADLEALTHPAIREKINERVAAAFEDPMTRGVIVEIPLLRVMAETPWRKLAVLAPEDVRVERAVARGNDRNDVIRRIANQEPDEVWAEWADVVIDNGGTWDNTVGKIDEIVFGPETSRDR